MGGWLHLSNSNTTLSAAFHLCVLIWWDFFFLFAICSWQLPVLLFHTHQIMSQLSIHVNTQPNKQAGFWLLVAPSCGGGTTCSQCWNCTDWTCIPVLKAASQVNVPFMKTNMQSMLNCFNTRNFWNSCLKQGSYSFHATSHQGVIIGLCQHVISLHIHFVLFNRAP